MIFTLGLLSLLVWMFRAFTSKNHPNLRTDPDGRSYCPAMRMMEENQERRRLNRALQRELRITGRTAGALGNQSTPPPTSPPSTPSLAQEIVRLAELKAKGLITEEQFNELTRKLIAS